MTEARLLPQFQRVYPTFPRGWFPVVGEERLGFWVEGAGTDDPFVSPGRRFCATAHLETREVPPAVCSSGGRRVGR